MAVTLSSDAGSSLFDNTDSSSTAETIQDAISFNSGRIDFIDALLDEVVITNEENIAILSREIAAISVGAGTSDHTLLTNIGTNTHAQIDTHLANTSNPHSVTKAQVGLGSAENTSDASKPISTATQTALDLKQTIIAGSLPVFIQATEPSVTSLWVDTTGGNIQLWIKTI